MLAGIVDALNAYEQMGLKAGDTVAVIGVGAMGLSAVATARALDLNVIALGGTGNRVEIARNLGAEVIGIAAHGEDLKDRAFAHTPGGFAAVMETTASDWGIAQAFAVAAPGAIVALTGGGQLPLTSWDVVNRELRIVGIRCGHHQDQAVNRTVTNYAGAGDSICERFITSPISNGVSVTVTIPRPRSRFYFVHVVRTWGLYTPQCSLDREGVPAD